MALIDDERVRNLYTSGAYEKNTHDWQDRESDPRAQAVLEAIEVLSEDPANIVDVGCGAGGVLLRMAQSDRLRNAQFLGLDISEAAIERAKSKAALEGKNFTRLDYQIGSFDEMAAARGNRDKHDLVMLIHVLEHCPDIEAVLRLVCQNSKYVYINVPIEITPMYAMRPKVYQNLYLRYGHLHFFTEGFLEEFFRSKNFVVLSKVYSKDYQATPGSLRQKFIKTVRTMLIAVCPMRIAYKLVGGVSVGYLLEGQ
jgi:SAM-dependent methyltransferase